MDNLRETAKKEGRIVYLFFRTCAVAILALCFVAGCSKSVPDYMRPSSVDVSACTIGGSSRYRTCTFEISEADFKAWADVEFSGWTTIHGTETLTIYDGSGDRSVISIGQSGTYLAAGKEFHTDNRVAAYFDAHTGITYVVYSAG